MTESLSAGTASALSPAERAALLASLRHMGLITADAEPRLVPVSGGVSSIIARVEDGPRRLCVKRALDKLLVAEDWHVPVDRNRNEVAWMREAARALPQVVPEILGDDHVRNIFAMTWLEPRDYPVWKTELLAGAVSPAFAASVGRTLGVIHAATAGRDDVARRFATDASFHALRLEPYFETSARRNPDLAGTLTALAARTANTRRVLVHGDVSPKNILAGPSGPVFLDAECAWYGDPAFDLAFCLNHLLLKAVHRPDSAEALMAAYDALHRAYLPMVTWEEPAAVERRTADLLPALALARVDGKSPVEYLDAGARDAVRKAARGLLTAPPATLSDVQRVWGETI